MHINILGKNQYEDNFVFPYIFALEITFPSLIQNKILVPLSSFYHILSGQPYYNNRLLLFKDINMTTITWNSRETYYLIYLKIFLNLFEIIIC